MSIRRALQRVWTLGLVLGLSSCAASNKSTEHAPAADQGVAVATPGLFLYEVRRGDASAHLLGTIHVGFGFDEVLTDDARARFNASTRVMTEADVSAANPGQLIQAALLPPDRSLSTLLGKEVWERLLARIGAEIPAPLLDRLEPWLPTVMLGLQDLERALKELKPDSATKLMDVELMKRATAEKKALSHFETVEEQIAIFESISLEEQLNELKESLTAESSEQARALLSSFAAGDDRALTKAIFDNAQLARAPGFYERVLFARNERWLPIVEREVAKDCAFIAVGAAHLLGDRGLLRELARRGYEVRRVGQ
jgi:uncharacterized protein